MRWFGHIQMRVINVTFRKSELTQVEDTKIDKGK